jgi:hypothetical protein
MKKEFNMAYVGTRLLTNRLIALLAVMVLSGGAQAFAQSITAQIPLGYVNYKENGNGQDESHTELNTRVAVNPITNRIYVDYSLLEIGARGVTEINGADKSTRRFNFDNPPEFLATIGVAVNPVPYPLRFSCSTRSTRTSHRFPR